MVVGEEVRDITGLELRGQDQVTGPAKAMVGKSLVTLPSAKRILVSIMGYAHANSQQGLKPKDLATMPTESDQQVFCPGSQVRFQDSNNCCI